MPHHQQSVYLDAATTTATFETTYNDVIKTAPMLSSAYLDANLINADKLAEIPAQLLRLVEAELKMDIVAKANWALAFWAQLAAQEEARVGMPRRAPESLTIRPIENFANYTHAIETVAFVMGLGRLADLFCNGDGFDPRKLYAFIAAAHLYKHAIAGSRYPTLWSQSPGPTSLMQIVAQTAGMTFARWSGHSQGGFSTVESVDGAWIGVFETRAASLCELDDGCTCVGAIPRGRGLVLDYYAHRRGDFLELAFSHVNRSASWSNFAGIVAA